MLTRTCAVMIGLTLLASGIAQGKVPGNLMGKAFFSVERIKDVDQNALTSRFSRAKPAIELVRGKDKHWKATLVAFFRKPATDGPMTLWLYDKSDKESLKAKEPTHMYSVEGGKQKLIFIHDLDIDPDRGFNKGYTYLIHIGQIFGKRQQIYARGEVSLK